MTVHTDCCSGIDPHLLLNLKGNPSTAYALTSILTSKKKKKTLILMIRISAFVFVIIPAVSLIY